MVKFENKEIWADLENRNKVVHSENFPIWRPASGDRDHVTHHVISLFSYVTHWGQWKYASRSWHAVGNHRRQLKLMFAVQNFGPRPQTLWRIKFQWRPRPDHTPVHSNEIFMCSGWCHARLQTITNFVTCEYSRHILLNTINPPHWRLRWGVLN